MSHRRHGVRRLHQCALEGGQQFECQQQLVRGWEGGKLHLETPTATVDPETSLASQPSSHMQHMHWLGSLCITATSMEGITIRFHPCHLCT